jgi:hypothetical protein
MVTNLGRDGDKFRVNCAPFLNNLLHCIPNF